MLFATAAESYAIAFLEEETALHDEVAHPFHARPEQIDDREEPGVAIADELVPPQPLGLEERFEAARELIRRETHDVLLVEPVELLGIEDPALPPLIPSSANPATSSSRVKTSRSFPGDHPSSARKLNTASGRYPFGVLHDRRGTMPLAQPLLVVTEDERHMGERGSSASIA